MILRGCIYLMGYLQKYSLLYWIYPKNLSTLRGTLYSQKGRAKMMSPLNKIDKPSKSLMPHPLQGFATGLYQITEQLCLIHAFLQHLLKAFLHCCNILVIGHSIPCIIGF